MRSPALLIAVLAIGTTRADDATSPAEVFQKRLLPIFKSPNPSSCTQCHLAAVELKDYILPDHEKTFRSLRDQGLIDLDRPEQSKILQLINRGATDKNTAGLIPAKQRQAEYEAFAAWIKACAADPKLRTSPKLNDKELAHPAASDEAIRYARKDRLLESFEKNIWSMRFRCMNCHTEGNPQNDKLRTKHGPRVAWMKKAGAEATMNYLLASKLVETDNPEQSLLLLKPLKAVDHGGGKKFVLGDLGYKGFRAWLEDVAAVRSGKYTKSSDLPPKENGPLQFGSEAWLKVTNTAPAWADKLLRADVYAWDAHAGHWETKPIATSDRVVFGPGKLWQHTLTLLAERGSDRAKSWTTGKPALPPGKYLVKLYVDANDRLKKDWRASLGAADYVGQVEIPRASWREGYQTMTTADAAKVRP